MNILFIDTETNSLPINRTLSFEHLDNWPRIVQISWALFSDLGIPISEKNYIIKPNGFKIDNNGRACQTNGITQEIADLNGISIHDALIKFNDAVDSADLLVAHNMNFDRNVTFAEYLRDGQEERTKVKKKSMCTQKVGTDFCKIPGYYGDYKWASLSELYFKLFNERFEAHNAKNDVEALAKCYFELKRLDFI